MLALTVLQGAGAVASVYNATKKFNEITAEENLKESAGAQLARLDNQVKKLTRLVKAK